MGSNDDRIREWTGGPLSELISVLSGAALPSRIEVFGQDSSTPAGEVHLLAGGLNDAMAGNLRGQDAVAALQKLSGARFVIETRLPDPASGSLTKPGPADGNLAERPLVELMRYCEEYVLTCTLEVWRGEEQARLSYRRGELVGTLVGGSDAPDQLPQVMAWKEGFYELALPPPATPPMPAPSKRNTANAAVVGVNVPSAPASRPISNERPRQGTDPLISVDAIKRQTPTRSVPARTADPGQAPRMPPGPPMPGLKGRSPTPHSQPAVGARPAQAAPTAPAARPANPEQPVTIKIPPDAAGAARAPAPPAFLAQKPVAPRSPAPPPGQSAQPAVTPRPVSRTAEPQGTPAPRGAAGIPRHATPAQGFEIKAPPAPERVPLPPPPTKAPAPAQEPNVVTPPPSVANGGARPARARASKSRPAGPPAIRGAGAITADKAPSVFNTTSGEIRRQNTPVRGIDSPSSKVELSHDMQDPAAFVNTPAPTPAFVPAEELPSKVQVAEAPAPADKGARGSDRLSAYTSVQNNDLAGDTDKHVAPSRRSARRGIGRWPLAVHIVLGIVLGVGVVVAYSLVRGLPLSLP